MTEQIWWAAGARLPIVMCVANRAMAAPWNVLNDQQDSMSVRDAGWVQLYCRTNQEILDTTVQAFKIAERSNVPVMVCYDGFLLSHTMMPVDVPSAEVVDGFLPPRTQPLQIVDVNDPRNVGPVTLADPRRTPTASSSPATWSSARCTTARSSRRLRSVPETDAEWEAALGRSWGGLTCEYLLDDAEVVLVAAGSLVTQLTLVAETLRAEGVRAGVLGIRCYRPFPVDALREKLAGRALALVFDKALSYGFQGPIAEDLKAALYAAEDAPAVFGAICGLGGRDVSPDHLAAAARDARR